VKLFPFQKEAVEKLERVKAVLIGDYDEPGPLFGMRIELFLKKIRLNDDGCWIWTGALGGSALYGTYAWRYRDKFNNQRKNQRPAHIITYMIFHGLIPDGLIIDHLCRVHECVSPHDLEAVTHKENQRRGLNGILKTECINGHDFFGENIYVDPRGWRECRTCRYEAVRRFRAGEVM
jgi:hypothetical protein